MKKQNKQPPKKKKQTQRKTKRTPANAITQSIALPTSPQGKRLALHFMHGSPANAPLCKDFGADHWHNVRLAQSHADITGGLQDIQLIADTSCDGVWLQNILPQLTYPEVTPFLQQVMRILRPGGVLLAMVPDLQKLAETMRDTGLERPLMQNNPKGPALIDFLYGSRNLKEGTAFRTGFTAHTLANRLISAGFGQITVRCDGMYCFSKAQKPTPEMKLQKKPQIIQEDVNAMMVKRDEIDVPPATWDNNLKL